MKTHGILLLSFVSIHLTGNAQQFTSITGTGFNYDVIANSNTTAALSTDKTIVPNLCFYANDFVSTLNPQAAPLGLPANRIINSAYRPEVTYQLANYEQPNVIMVGVDSDNHSFTLATPTAYTTLSLLMTNNYPSSVCVEVNFDDKTRSFFNFNTKGWDSSNAAYPGCGVVNINTDEFSGTALTHHLYDYILTLSETDRVKKITSIRFSKSDIGSMLYVFAVSGSNNSTYTGITATPVLEGDVVVDTDIRYTDTGGEWFCYANGTTHKVTFTPKDATKKIRLMFDYFKTYCVFDLMKIYNGKEADATKLIAQYYLTITNDEKEVIATNPDGALTCVFSTNAFFPHLGWSGVVSQIALNTLDLKALNTSAASLTPPIDEAIPLTLKIRNYSTTPIKGTDYTIQFTDANNLLLATAEGIDIEPGVIASIAAPITITATTAIKGEIVYVADQNPADNISAPITLSPLPQIKMDNGTRLIDDAIYNFFDEGGINYNYSDNHILTLTIQPNVANKAVRVKFSMFKLESFLDDLKIYNGAAVADGTLIGTFSGEDDIIPTALKEIKATNDNGALTLVFHSDTYTNRKGWEALIDLVDVAPVIVPDPDAPPMVSTLPMSDITSTSATAHGYLTSLGKPAPQSIGICYSTTHAFPSIDDNCFTIGGTATIGAFTAPINNLTKGVTYHVRAFATNTAGTSYGEVISFTTLKLLVSTTTLGIGNDDGSAATFDISSNTVWTVIANDDWVSVSGASGTGNATVTLTATANPSTDKRESSVTISSEGFEPQTIIITQDAAPANLSLSQSTVAFESEGGTVMIDIASNTSWIATVENDEWLAIETTKSANSKLMLSATINPSSTSRTTMVTIHTENSEIVKTVTVMQSGAIETATNNPMTQAYDFIYPNPCTNGFTIESVDARQTLTITNLTGCVVMNQSIEGKTFVNTEDLKSGIYLIKVGNRVEKLRVR